MHTHIYVYVNMCIYIQYIHMSPSLSSHHMTTQKCSRLSKGNQQKQQSESGWSLFGLTQNDQIIKRHEKSSFLLLLMVFWHFVATFTRQYYYKPLGYCASQFTSLIS